jgi:serine/threonine protein kinase/Tol biopolymer transport system component
MQLTSGTRLDTYEIRHRVAAGGMGEVYYARDTTLGRFVALKLLLPELTTNEDRVRRFLQEARAASGLNHPNIITVHEIGHTDSLHYIASEFVDGETIRTLIAESRIYLDDAIEIAIQSATALAAAHDSGIVHRDIKPENIMVRRDGLVKVLDFGLAKLMPTAGHQMGDPSFSTLLNVNTDPGTFVGTVYYMSPEQLRGLPVDGRADIWSLGVVIYEMIARRPPFIGITNSDVIASILREEPQDLTSWSEDIPGELQRIVDKMLRKNADERYGTAKELLADLKGLKRKLDQEERPSRPRSPARLSNAVTEQSTRQLATDEGAGRRAHTSRVHGPGTASFGGQLYSEIKEHRLRSALLILAVLVTLGSLVWFMAFRRAVPAQQPEPAMSIAELPTTANVREAVLSPDGKLTALIVEDAGKQGIRVQQAGSSSGSTIFDSPANNLRGLVFARDGYSLYYLAKEPSGSALYQVSTFGGTQRKLTADIATPVALAPDGSRISFVRRKPGGTVLISAKADGTDERELAALSGPTEFGTFTESNNGPAWSPDGQTIACPVAGLDEPFFMKVVTVRVADGTVADLGSRRWFFVGQLAWTPDGSGLLATAQEKAPPMATSQIWFLAFPNGEAKPITSDANHYRGVSVNADATSLLTLRTEQTSNIWIVSDLTTNAAAPVVASKNKGSGGIAWTTEGKLLYASNESGWQELWTMDADGQNARQLTFDQHTNVEPAISPSAPEEAVFASYATGQPHIWRINRTTGALNRLTNGAYEDWPDLSPNGEWVAYHDDVAGKERIWKVPVNGGQSVPLSDQQARHPIFSPDGQSIACFIRDERAEWKLAVIPAAGGKPSRTFPIAAEVAEQWAGPRWTRDSQGVTYISTRGGVSNIWLQPLGNSPARALTSFAQDLIFTFAWSPDGEKLACVRGTTARTAVLLRNFRK